MLEEEEKLLKYSYVKIKKLYSFDSSFIIYLV